MSRDTRILACFIAALALIILSASVTTTVAVAHGAPKFLRAPFLIMCHGIPHRCLTIAGTPMPICARCVGIYVGLILGLALFPMLKWVNERLMKIVLVAAAIPMFLDGTTQAIGLRESTNPLRLATGLTAAAAFGLWVLVSIETRARQRLAES